MVVFTLYWLNGQWFSHCIGWIVGGFHIVLVGWMVVFTLYWLDGWRFSHCIGWMVGGFLTPSSSTQPLPPKARASHHHQNNQFLIWYEELHHRILWPYWWSLRVRPIGNIFCQSGILSVTAPTRWSHPDWLNAISRMPQNGSHSQSCHPIYFLSFSFLSFTFEIEVENFFDFLAARAPPSGLLPAIKRIELLRAETNQSGGFKLGQLSPILSQAASTWLSRLPRCLWPNCTCCLKVPNEQGNRKYKKIFDQMKVKVVKRRAAGEQLGGGGWAEICPRLRCSAHKALYAAQCTRSRMTAPL